MAVREDIFQQAMNQGHSAAWDQMWDQAARFYRQALQEFPDHPQALTSLGLALYEQQEYEESLRIYQRAARLLPNDPLPVDKVAQIFERLGNLDQSVQASLYAAELYLRNRDVNKAIESWGRVTRLKPENLQAHNRLALVYEKTGEKKKAVEEYLAVASLNQAAGDMEKAVRAVNQALTVAPDSQDAAQALTLLRDFKPLPRPVRPRGGTAPLRMSQVRQMEAPVTQAAPDGDDPIAQARQKALTLLAGLLFEGAEEPGEGQDRSRGLGQIVRGTGSLNRPVDRSRIILHLGQVVDLQTRGENAQAAEELERAIEAGLDHPASYFDLGYLQAELGHISTALRYLQIAANHPDYALASHLMIGNMAMQAGNLQQAAIQYLEALKLADMQAVPAEKGEDLSQLYEPLIEAQRLNRSREAQQTLCENVRALLLHSDWRTRISQARQQLPGGASDSHPLPLAEILTEARSSQVVDSISVIHQLASQGYLRSAMEETFFALQHAPTYLPLHTYMGELLIQQGHLEDAIEKFTVIANTYNTRGEVSHATELYRRILKLAPMELNVRARLIDLLMAQGRMEEVLAEYLELAEAYYNQANLEMTRKTYTEALRLAQQARVDRSWRVKILHHMADIDLQSLDWRQALRIFEQIRTMQPDDEQARLSLVDLNFRLGQENQALAELDNYLAYLTSANQQQQGVSFLEALVKENPERLPLRRRLADLYRSLGESQKAVEQLDAIGETALQNGDKKTAILAIEAILATNPPNREDYLKVLQEIKGASPA
jgi:tetratricopeptide (TPR) repeat protein